MDSGRTRHRRRLLLTAIKPTGLLQRQTASRGAVCFLRLPRYGQFCGGAQAWDAAGYERNARFVSDLGAEVLDLLAPKPDETILDLGCGDGALTERIAASGRACEAATLPQSLYEQRACGDSMLTRRTVMHCHTLRNSMRCSQTPHCTG